MKKTITIIDDNESLVTSLSLQLNISNYDNIHNIRREVWTLYQKKGLLYTEFLKKNINVSTCQIIPSDKNWRPYFLWKWLRHFEIGRAHV